jgi:hypothetical protein
MTGTRDCPYCHLNETDPEPAGGWICRDAYWLVSPGPPETTMAGALTRRSWPPGRGHWTGMRSALASAAVCRSPETAWHACAQDLPSSVAAQVLPSDTDTT